MIEGYCRTNLDDYKKQNWPTEFVSVPKEGDRVRADDRSSLKVCGITYVMIKKYDYQNEIIWVPGIEIELNK